MHRLAWRAVVVGAPVLGYALVTWPWVTRMWSRAPGGDGAAFVWSFWWMRHALETGQSPLSTTAAFAPYGAPLVLNTGLPLPALVSVPLQWLVGAPLAFNLVAVALVVLAAVCTTALARDLGLARVPALFAGLAFAFSPAVADRYAYLEHLNLSTVFWIPLLLLAVRRWQRAPTWRRAVVVGVIVAGAAWSDFTVTFLALFAAALYALAATATGRVTVRRAVLSGLVAVAVPALLVAPIIVAIASGLASGDLEADRGENSARFYSMDLAGLVVGNPENPILGGLVAPVAARLGGRFDGANDLGVVIVGLALVGFVSQRRSARARWLALLAFAALAVALGPVLWVAGRQYVPVPVAGRGEGPMSALLPFTWLQGLPGLSGLRAPGRFTLLAALPIALLAGFGLQRLGRPLLVAAVAVPLVLVEAASPVTDTLDAGLPHVYEVVAADPDPDVIVVDVPLGFSRGVDPVGRWSDLAGLAATGHEKRTAAGFASRLGDAPIERLTAIGLYRDLLALQDLPPGQPAPPTSPTEGADSARRHGLSYVVLAEPTAGADVVRAYLARACFRSVEQAQGLELYRFGCSG